MRIRGSSISSSYSASSSSYAAISTYSFDSSTNCVASSPSNSTSPSSTSTDYQTRCEGLDLLAQAVLHVAGSVLGVPFTKRRVIRRGKRASQFSKIVVTEIFKKEEEEEEEKTKQEGEIEVISKPKRRKRVMALPSKYQDSVLQPWKRQNRRRRSIEMDD